MTIANFLPLTLPHPMNLECCSKDFVNNGFDGLKRAFTNHK